MIDICILLEWCKGNTSTDNSESLGGFDSPFHLHYLKMGCLLNSYYHEHCENLRLIEGAISSVQRTLREYISKNDDKNSEIYTKILAYLINCWAEVRIMKLVYEKNAFTGSEMTKIIGQRSLNDKWKKSLEIAYPKSFQKPSGTQINDPRYSMLLDIIDNQLLPSAQIRNRLAHGQWKFAFTNNLQNINNILTNKIRDDNILKIQLRYKIFKNLSQLIHDLVVSTPTFDRDFNDNFRKIEEKKHQMSNRKYEVYVNTLVTKRIKGQNKKHSN